MSKKRGFDTRAIHAGQRPDPVTGSIMTPVHLTSTYVQRSPGEHTGYEYSRTGNPTRTALEQNLASLEEGKHGLTFGSGLAATSTLMQTLSPGDHVVVCDDVYGGTYRLFDKVWQRFNLKFSFVSLDNPDDLQQHLTPETKMVWLESPTNPLLKILDIRKLAATAKAAGAMTVVDNTFATPYLQQPLKLGADVVVHSTTKYLNGHSDVVGGVLITNDDALGEQLAFLQNAIGAVPGPMDCFLVMRGTKTLGVRMRQHESNAQAIAEFLAGHSQVASVTYPGLAEHPQHDLAKEQMRGFGGMVTFELKGGLAASRRFLEAIEVFSLAESLGGVESLIEHPAIMTHASIEKPIREKLGITDGLIRLSVGIEDIDDLIAGLETGFVAAK